MPTFEQITSLLLLQTRMWLGKKRFGSNLGPSVVRLSKTRLIKGPCERAELEGLKYVAEHTSIPVPAVHQTYCVDGHLYIEMEYIQGDNLQDLWMKHDLSPTKKRAIVEQVAAYINQLRLLQPPRKEEGVVASAGLGPGLDIRVGYRTFGPFFSNDEFHSFLRGQIPLEYPSQLTGESVRQCHTRQYRTCFTHGDICPRNIIVRNDGVAVLVDWQFSGWYPEYWEYTKAHFAILNMPDWYTEFRDAVSRYDDELASERVLWTRFDQPGMFQ